MRGINESNPYVEARREWNDRDLHLALRTKAAQHERDQQTTVAGLSRVAVDSLNFDYAIDAESVPWKPIRVFDDDTHVYIQMPQTMRVTDAPALFVQTRAGDTAL